MKDSEFFISLDFVAVGGICVSQAFCYKIECQM